MTTPPAARRPAPQTDLFRSAAPEPPATTTAPHNRSDQAMRALRDPFTPAASAGVE